MNASSTDITQFMIDIYKILSNYSLKMGNYADAKRYLEKLLQQYEEKGFTGANANYEFASIYSDIGWCCFKVEDLVHAKEWLEKAIQIQKEDVLLENAEHFQETVCTNIKSNEDFADFLEFMSISWIKLKQPQKAKETLDRYISITKNLAN